MAIVAPFWATTETRFAFRYGHSKVYYQVYSQTKDSSSEILKMASQDVKRYTEGGTFANFAASWVLVVTWYKLCPYVYYPYYYYYYYSGENFPLNCPWVSISFSSFFILSLISIMVNRTCQLCCHLGPRRDLANDLSMRPLLLLRLIVLCEMVLCETKRTEIGSSRNENLYFVRNDSTYFYC